VKAFSRKMYFFYSLFFYFALFAAGQHQAAAASGDTISFGPGKVSEFELWGAKHTSSQVQLFVRHYIVGDLLLSFLNLKGYLEPTCGTAKKRHGISGPGGHGQFHFMHSDSFLELP
jgi:hypothetical protein